MKNYVALIAGAALIALGYLIGRITDETVVLNLDIKPETLSMLSISDKHYYLSSRGDEIFIDFDCFNTKIERNKVRNEHDYIYGRIPATLKPSHIKDSKIGFYCSGVYTSFNFTDKKLTSIGLVAPP